MIDNIVTKTLLPTLSRELLGRLDRGARAKEARGVTIR